MNSLFSLPIHINITTVTILSDRKMYVISASCDNILRYLCNLTTSHACVKANRTVEPHPRLSSREPVFDLRDLFFGVKAHPALCRFTQFDNWSFCAFFHVHSFSKDLLECAFVTINCRHSQTADHQAVRKLKYIGGFEL